MIIKITNNNRVCLIVKGATDKYKADGKTFFEVESVPKREKNTFLFYNPESKEFRIEPRPPVPEAVLRKLSLRAARQKRDAALKWLSENDWKVNKHTLGEWSDTDERWLTYLADREKVRAQYDEAEVMLQNIIQGENVT